MQAPPTAVFRDIKLTLKMQWLIEGYYPNPAISEKP